MNSVKLIALLMFAVIFSVGVPHFSFFGLGIGSGTVNAADPTGASVYPSNSVSLGAYCVTGTNGKYRCAFDSSANRFTIAKCGQISWYKNSPEFSFNGYDQCLNACKNPSSVGTTSWKSTDCIEPYDQMTKTPSGDIKQPFQTTIKSTTNYPKDGTTMHKISFDIVTPDGKHFSRDSGNNCNGLQTCDYTDSYNGWSDGTIVNYWSEVKTGITFPSSSDGTYIRNPQGAATYSFKLSSSGGGGGGTGTSCGSGGTCSSQPSGTSTGAIFYTGYSVCGGNYCKLTDTAVNSCNTCQGQGASWCVSGDSKTQFCSDSCPSGFGYSDCSAVDTTGGGATTKPTPTPGDSCSGSFYCAVPDSSSALFYTGMTGCSSNELCAYDYGGIYDCSSCEDPNVDGTWCTNNGVSFCSGNGDCNGWQPDYLCSGSSSGTSSDSSIDINPKTATQNQNTKFTVSFDMPLYSVRSIAVKMKGSSSNSRPSFNVPVDNFCSPQSCDTFQTISVADTYVTYVELTKTDNTKINSNIITIAVSASNQQTPGTGTSSSGHCCVIEYSPGQFDYNDKITSDAECQSSGGRFYPRNSCTDAVPESATCNTFCSKQSRTSGSCIYTNSPNAQGSDAHQNVCRQGELCQCGGVNSQNYQYNVECSQACYTSSYGSGVYTPYYSSQQTTTFPVGQCTDNPQGFISSWVIGNSATQTGGSVVQQPRILSGPNSGRGLYQCQPNEFCVCTYLNFNAFTANTNRPSTPLLPGTKTWADPEDISDRAPTAAANDRICDAAAANATITATLSLGSGTSSNSNLKLIQAGDSVTITGSVAKLADTCKGYTYTCRREKVMYPCKEEKRVIYTNLAYPDCPAGLPEDVHKEGGGKKWNWRLISSIAASILAPYLLPALGISPAIVEAAKNAAISNTIGAAVDGLNCGTNREGTGNVVSNMIYQATQGGGSGKSYDYICLLPSGQAYCSYFGSISACQTNCVDENGKGSCVAATDQKACDLLSSSNPPPSSSSGGSGNSYDYMCALPSGQAYCSYFGSKSACQTNCWDGSNQGRCIPVTNQQACNVLGSGSSVGGSTQADLNFCCNQNTVLCDDGSGKGYCVDSSVSCPSGYTKQTCAGTGSSGGLADLNFCCNQGSVLCDDGTGKGYCIDSSVSCPSGYTKQYCSGQSVNDNAQCWTACIQADPTFDYGICETSSGEFSFLAGENGCNINNYCHCYKALPSSLSTTFSPDPPVVNVPDQITLKIPKFYDAIHIYFTTSLPTDTIDLTLDETGTGVWTKTFTFTKVKLYDYTVKATTLNGHIDTVTNGKLNVVTSSTGAATAKPTIPITGNAVNPQLAGTGINYALNQVPACPSQQDYNGCFRVCGKKYETDASRAPACVSTVLAYKDATYKCGQGSCGGFTNKKVRVQIKDPSGTTVIDDSTTTDTNGEFSYTFTAPAADGEFIAVVSVPKG